MSSDLYEVLRSGHNYYVLRKREDLDYGPVDESPFGSFDSLDKYFSSVCDGARKNRKSILIIQGKNIIPKREFDKLNARARATQRKLKKRMH